MYFFEFLAIEPDLAAYGAIGPTGWLNARETVQMLIFNCSARSLKVIFL